MQARRLRGTWVPARPDGARRTDGATADRASAVAAPEDAAGPAADRKSVATAPRPKLSKDAYRRRKAAVEEELRRLGRRKEELEAALQDPAVHGNFVELRRIAADLATVGEALAAAETAWLEVEEAAP